MRECMDCVNYSENKGFNFRPSCKNYEEKEEVTYSIGDRFKDRDGPKKIILVHLSNGRAGLRQLENGWYWGRALEGAKVANKERITCQELDAMLFGPDRLVRYWDNRKQKDV